MLCHEFVSLSISARQSGSELCMQMKKRQANLWPIGSFCRIMTSSLGVSLYANAHLRSLIVCQRSLLGALVVSSRIVAKGWPTSAMFAPNSDSARPPSWMISRRANSGSVRHLVDADVVVAVAVVGKSLCVVHKFNLSALFRFPPQCARLKQTNVEPVHQRMAHRAALTLRVAGGLI